MAQLTTTKVTGELEVTGNVTGNVTGDLTGNAATATKLAEARTLSLTGGVTGSASFDGSANASITATVADGSHSHDTQYYKKAEAVPSGADLNDYLVPGFYYCSSTETASTMSNIPVAHAFSLRVYLSAGVTQHWQRYNSSDVYVRSYYSASGWTAWSKLSLDGHTHAGTDVTSAVANATNATTQAADDDSTKIATTAHVKSVVADYAPLATLLGTGLGASVVPLGPADANTLVAPGFWSGRGANGVNWDIAQYGFMIVSRRVDKVLQIGINSTGSEMKLRISTDAGATWESWYRQYSDYNILGTVSQSGGIPTGAVIERGSNANGEYVKFADGTMICSILKTVTDQAINSTYGSLYTGTRTWTFPAVFVDSPVVTTSSAKWGTGAAWAITSGVSSVASAPIRFFDIVSRSAGTTFIYSASAIGRWF